jgi:hypothetical protein
LCKSQFVYSFSQFCVNLSWCTVSLSFSKLCFGYKAYIKAIKLKSHYLNENIIKQCYHLVRVCECSNLISKTSSCPIHQHTWLPVPTNLQKYLKIKIHAIRWTFPIFRYFLSNKTIGWRPMTQELHRLKIGRWAAKPGKEKSYQATSGTVIELTIKHYH